MSKNHNGPDEPKEVPEQPEKQDQDGAENLVAEIVPDPGRRARSGDRFLFNRNYWP